MAFNTKKLLLFLSYAGHGFNEPVNISLFKSKSSDSVETALKRVLLHYFGPFCKLKLGVETNGANAMINTVALEVRMNRSKYINNEVKMHTWVLNYKLIDREYPIKILKTINMPENFCIKESAQYYNYVFRFSNKNISDINITNYPFVSGFRDKINVELLESVVMKLNELFKENQYQIFSHQDSYFRRKMNIDPIKIEINSNTNSIFSSFQFDNENLYSIQVKNLPISSNGVVVYKLLNLIFMNLESIKNNSLNLLDEIAEIFKYPQKEIKQDYKFILNMNGIYLTHIHYNHPNIMNN